MEKETKMEKRLDREFHIVMSGQFRTLAMFSWKRGVLFKTPKEKCALIP